MTIYNEDAERAVLSAVLIESEAITSLGSTLRPESFYSAKHGAIYAAMQSLHTTGTRIDPLTLSAELERGGVLQSVGGKDYIGGLVDDVPTAANIAYHANIVRSTKGRRDLVKLLTETAELAALPSSNPTEIAASVQQMLLPYALETDGRGYKPMRDFVIRAIEEIEARGRAAREGKTLGVTTGYPEIDDITNGFREGELVSIFGGPKCGKTAFTLAVAMHNSLNADGVGFVCAEMTGQSLAERCINSVGRIKTAETSRGMFEGDGWKRVVDTGKIIAAQKNMFVDDEAFPELGDVIARALHLKSQNPKIKLLVVDYLQLVTHRMKGRRGDEEINEICKGLKGLAKRAELVVIAPGQTNYKEVDARSVPKPTIRDVQGASGPAQTSDFLFLAYRDPMIPDSFELELGASRRTDRFTAQLTWAGQFMRVESPRAIQFGRTTFQGAA